MLIGQSFLLMQHPWPNSTVGNPHPSSSCTMTKDLQPLQNRETAPWPAVKTSCHNERQQRSRTGPLMQLAPFASLTAIKKSIIPDREGASEMKSSRQGAASIISKYLRDSYFSLSSTTWRIKALRNPTRPIRLHQMTTPVATPASMLSIPARGPVSTVVMLPMVWWRFSHEQPSGWSSSPQLSSLWLWQGVLLEGSELCQRCRLAQLYVTRPPEPLGSRLRYPPRSRLKTPSISTGHFEMRRIDPETGLVLVPTTLTLGRLHWTEWINVFCQQKLSFAQNWFSAVFFSNRVAESEKSVLESVLEASLSIPTIYKFD